MTGPNQSLVDRLRSVEARAKLVGESPPFVAALSQLDAITKSDDAVLITGETGTGKEMVARAIHYMGTRAGFPFVPLNCGALPDTLFEDEIFGHERGAFTDAHSRRPGLISQAEKGTLFLDEVEALTPKGQVALLRVLQDKAYRPLGSTQQYQGDVRFLAASNAQLPQQVRAGAFRADLYYRLCVFTIDLPPLRMRKDDIPLLASHFLRKHVSGEREGLQLSPRAHAALVSFDWPGNVRELESTISRAIQVCRTGSIDIEDLGLPHVRPTAEETSPSMSYRALKRRTVDAFEFEYLTRLMGEYRGNVTRAAHAAGKERRDFGRLLKKHGLDPRTFSGAGDGQQAAG